MNNNFLARGKCEDNGKWVEGYLVEQNDPEYHAYIIRSFKADIDNRYIDILECDIEEVIPETVGRRTGLTDKNGTLIFEGDICDAAGERCIIIYRRSAFFADFGNYCPYLNDVATKNFEIVGNIHDNPELIGGESNET